MPVVCADDVGDGAVVVELETVGLRECSFEATFRDRRGEVEEGAGDRGGRDAFTAGGVLLIEGARGVQSVPRDADAAELGGDVDAGLLGRSIRATPSAWGVAGCRSTGVCIAFAYGLTRH
jgi:hypothetical protein